MLQLSKDSFSVQADHLQAIDLDDLCQFQYEQYGMNTHNIFQASKLFFF